MPAGQGRWGETTIGAPTCTIAAVEAPIEPRADFAPRAGRTSEAVALDLIGLLGLAAIGAGLMSLISGPMGYSEQGVVAGVASQIPTTLPAAILVLGASALNLAAGTVLARLARRAALPSLNQAILDGFVGAVILDAVLLFGLGGLELFTWPTVLAVHLAILAVGWRVRPILAFRLGARAWSLSPFWVFIAVAWSGAVVLQLAAPVVPFFDVLPNHVGTVEHLRTFGSWTELTTTASPIYGSSRTFLGYTALLGTMATLTGLPAGLAVSAFILPGMLLIAAGIYRLASALGGPTTGRWALLTFTLTASFARMADDRATVLVLPLVAWTLALFADRLRDDHQAITPRAGESLLIGAGLGAATLVHPVVGALAIGTVGLLILVWPSRAAAIGIPAVVTGMLIALPQLATMGGFGLPSVLGLIAFPLAAAAGLALERAGRLIPALVLVGRVAVVAIAAAISIALALTPSVAAAAVKSLGEIIVLMPLLTSITVVGLLFATRAVAAPVALAALAVGAVVAIVVELVPSQGFFLQAIHFELPKTLRYWIPVFLALTAALALDALWNARSVPLRVRAAVVAGLLLIVVLPLRPGSIDLLYLGEHRISETIAIDLRYADRGYWHGYPDSRRIVSADQQALLDVLRAEIATGQIGSATPILHVAASFQQWASTPLGVFLGVIETTVSPDAEVSIHTVGGRLRPLDELDAALESRKYRYVVIEPEGLSGDEADRIVAAGYRSIFANSQGEILVASDPLAP